MGGVGRGGGGARVIRYNVCSHDSGMLMLDRARVVHYSAQFSAIDCSLSVSWDASTMVYTLS